MDAARRRTGAAVRAAWLAVRDAELAAAGCEARPPVARGAAAAATLHVERQHHRAFADLVAHLHGHGLHHAGMADDGISIEALSDSTVISDCSALILSPAFTSTSMTATSVEVANVGHLDLLFAHLPTLFNLSVRYVDQSGRVAVDSQAASMPALRHLAQLRGPAVSRMHGAQRKAAARADAPELLELERPRGSCRGRRCRLRWRSAS